MKKSLLYPYVCARCKGEFEFEDLRYSNDGKKIFCVDCYNQISKIDEHENKKIEIAQKNTTPESIKLICTNCRYKFSLKKQSRIRVMCPYCGGNKLMRDEITASKLIEEVSQGYGF